MSAVAIIVQARMSSSRLPGKVLLPLAGAPAIVRMMERVARVTEAAATIVATSTHVSDDPLAEVCGAHGLTCARGPLDDVLGRFVSALPDDCDVVVRLTGDCPLIDPALVAKHIRAHRREQPWAQYVSNAVVRTQPDGLDVEVMSRALLEEAHRRATDPSDREHVTPWIIRHARAVPITQEVNLGALRWTMDLPDDHSWIASIYDCLHPTNPCFDRFDVYRLLLSRPELIRVAGRPSPLDEAERRIWQARIAAHLQEAS